MREDDFETSIKIVIVGNGIVGKSSMIQRYCNGVFSNDYKKTIGVDFLERIIRVDSTELRLMLWDTAGQEEFDALTKAYYRGAQGCVLAFSTTDKDSFDAIERWKKKVEYECGNIPMALVQNKIDLIDQAKVTPEAVDKLANRLGLPLFLTSARKNVNIDEVFYYLAKSYLDSLDDSLDEEEGDEDGDTQLISVKGKNSSFFKLSTSKHQSSALSNNAKSHNIRHNHHFVKKSKKSLRERLSGSSGGNHHYPSRHASRSFRQATSSSTLTGTGGTSPAVTPFTSRLVHHFVHPSATGHGMIAQPPPPYHNKRRFAIIPQHRSPGTIVLHHPPPHHPRHLPYNPPPPPYHRTTTTTYQLHPPHHLSHINYLQHRKEEFRKKNGSGSLFNCWIL